MVEIKTLDNGFEYIEIINQNAKAKIALQGAYIFSYETFKEHLWVSKLSCLKKGKAIRGGVPICWPWFGKKEG
ncbi:MAG: hypothetical protein JXQ66_06940 [Campylobacterales bacterium]|nr:hypothetical protein [Campylobacterales bacterium]